MSPIALDSLVGSDIGYDDDDDFIRTLSDEDGEGTGSYPLLEEEDHELEQPNALKKDFVRSNTTTTTTTSNDDRKTKRKHDELENGKPTSSLLQSQDQQQQARAQKQQKQKHVSNDRNAKHRASSTDGDLNSRVNGSDNEDSEAEGEDDGAINPDFEFQVDGGVEDGVIGDFDGWDIDEKKNMKGVQVADKKGVDIDELIARRRKEKGIPKMKNGETGGVANGVGFLEDEEPDGEMEEDESALEAAPDADDSDDDSDIVADDTFGMGAPLDEADGDEAADGDSKQSVPSSPGADEEEDAVGDPMPEPEGSVASDEGYDSEEEARRKDFFAPEEESILPSTMGTQPTRSFQNMSLSRPILRGLASVGFTNPTPIQTKTVPVALSGKDVVGGAVTGSGKTAAFIIPILERLLYRPKKIPTSRVAILMPTRELAVQCFNVAKKLASFTDIGFCLLTGGFSLREQENTLRSRPDVIIATPGRFIDHMRNSASFTTDTLEILVLDEADRMLDDGFADELNEILNTIPKSRQTMLFSATMTDQVDKLIRVGLRKPVRLMVDARKQTVVTLTQEFVRLRPGREDKRLATLLHLCSSVYQERVIVFFRQKKEAHRARVVFGLCDIKAAELHGSMSQEQRISALTSFRNGQATHLLATDLASRGLDIPFVSVVINFEAPQSHEIYLHRVGRTARAGRLGRSCTIAAESDRKIVKQAVKAAKAQGAKIASRVIESAIADKWASDIAGMDGEVEAVLKDEKEEKLLSQTDMSLKKGENLIKHESEIQSRPRRTWFETEKDKLKAKKAGQEELNGRVGHSKTKGGGKLSGKEKKELDDKRMRVEGRMWRKGKGDAAKPVVKGGGMKSSKSKGGPKVKSKASRPPRKK